MLASVPVDGDVLVAMVADVDDDDVAPARADGRPRELPVHGEDGLLVAQPRHVRLRDLQN